MTSSERLGNLIRGKPIDRLPVIEWAPWWNLTAERWVREGVPQEKTGYYELHKYFGLDPCMQTHLWFKSAALPPPPHHGAGIIRDRDDYKAIKKYLYIQPGHNITDEYIKWLENSRKNDDAVHFFTVEGFFWYPRTLFGIEPHMYSFFDYPELLKEICEDYSEWLIRAFQYAAETFRFDFMSFAEDMSYNNGPMLSKACFDEFLAPYYKRVIPELKKIGVPVFIDSDGDITMAVDWYAETGADGMFPLERQAGVDVGIYIKKQPQMTFLGHFDKMCMKFGEKAMRAEFERILPSAKAGKVIISVDHQTPPDVSLENYKTYVRLFKEYAATVKK